MMPCLRPNTPFAWTQPLPLPGPLRLPSSSYPSFASQRRTTRCEAHPRDDKRSLAPNLRPNPSPTPLLDKLEHESQRIRANFFYPGHKQGSQLHRRLTKLLGDKPFHADLPELPELDNLFAPEGVLRDAQTLYADTFTQEGSVHWASHFLVNGSTCGVEGAFLAVLRPGRKVVLPRNSHQCAVHALVLSGAVPVWVDPVYDPANDLLHGVTPSSIATALSNHVGEVDAVLVVSPTYHGVVSDVKAIASVAHAHGAKLIVDEAHGAHLTFHHALPPSAVQCDADIVVQSVHKSLTALSQAAVMHVRREAVDARRVQAALQLVQSSSPSYLLLASLDAARAHMQDDGTRLLSRAVKLARRCAQRIASLDGFSVLGVNDFGTNGVSAHSEPLVYGLDATKITVVLPPHLSGYDLDAHLIDQFGVYAELPQFRHLTFVVTVGTRQSDVDNLVTALSLYFATAPHPTTPPIPSDVVPSWRGSSRNSNSMTPRQAFFAESEVVSADQAVGRICAETLCPYPPGIPVLLPGEVVTSEGLEMIHRVLAHGGSLSGASDDSASKVRVVL